MGVDLINFEETELRLGLPGGKGTGNLDGAVIPCDAAKNNGKRGFSETVDLKLNLSSDDSGPSDQGVEKSEKGATASPPSTNSVKPPAK